MKLTPTNHPEKYRTCVPSKQDRLFFFGIFVLTISSAYIFSRSIDRSIWLDEAWVVNSILSDDLAGMFYYENWLQTSPPLFLFLVRTVSRVAGESEAALRIVPLTFAVASIGLQGMLARRILPPPWALLCAASLLASPLLPVLSQWVKQYTADLFAATLLLYLCARYLQSRARRDLVVSLLAYVPLSFLSYTTIFVAPVLLYGALFSSGELRIGVRPAALHRAAAVVATVLASASINWIMFVSPNRSDELAMFWRQAFILDNPFVVSNLVANLPVFLETSVFIRWLGLSPAAASLVGNGLTIVTAVVVFFGLLHEIRQRPLPTDRLALVCLPILAAVALNLVGQYPFSRRLLMATTPGMVILFVLGLRSILAALVGPARGRRRRSGEFDQALPSSRQIALALVVALVGLAFVRDDGETQEDVAAAADYIKVRIREQDSLYLAASMHEQFRYYNRRQPLQGSRIIYGKVASPCCRREPGFAISESSVDQDVETIFAADQSIHKLFAVFTDRGKVNPFPVQMYVRKLSDKGCNLSERKKFPGVAVLTFDCRSS